MGREELEIIVKGKDEASGVLDRVGGALGGFGKAAGGIALAGAAALGAGVVALGGVLADCVREASAAEEGQAQLAAVLQSTGGAAGVTAEMANGLADSLSQVTRFEDDAIIGAESMLLTFTNIGKDTFPAATRTALDMSQALGQDLKTSSIQLGKALNDPIAGISALQRVGVTFTDAQKEVIKKLVETGDVAGAQKVILAELQKEFGGSAEAAGKTFAGQLDILKNSLGNVKESVGMALMPALTQLATVLGPVLSQAAQAFAGWLINTVVPAISSVVAWVVANWPQIQATITTVFTTVQTVVQNVMTFISGIVTALFGGMTQTVTGHGTSIIGTITTAYNTISGIVQSVIGFVRQFVTDAITQTSTVWSSTWTTIQTTVQTVLGFIQQIVTVVLGIVREFIAKHGEDIRTTLLNAWNSISQIINGVVQIIQTVVTTVFGAITTFIGQHREQIVTILDAAWNMIRTIIETVLGVIRGIVNAVLAALRGDWEGAWEAIRGAAETLWEGIKTVISNAITIVRSVIEIALAAIRTVWEAIWNAIRSFLEAVWDGIRSKAESVWAGIRTFFSTTLTGVQTSFNTIWNGIQTFLVSIWTGIQTTAGTMWNAVKAAVLTPVEALWTEIWRIFNGIREMLLGIWTDIKDRVTGIVGDLIGWVKGAFAGFQIHIPMPHFGVSWQDIGWGVKLPSVSVSWYAKGGDFLTDGPMLIGVGENGPERVRITPTDRSRGGLSRDEGGGTTIININNPVVREEQDLRRITDMINEALSKQAQTNQRMGYAW